MIYTLESCFVPTVWQVDTDALIRTHRVQREPFYFLLLYIYLRAGVAVAFSLSKSLNLSLNLWSCSKIPNRNWSVSFRCWWMRLVRRLSLWLTTVWKHNRFVPLSHLLWAGLPGHTDRPVCRWVTLKLHFLNLHMSEMMNSCKHPKSDVHKLFLSETRHFLQMFHNKSPLEKRGFSWNE